MLKGAERERYDNHVARYVELGAPQAIAARVAALLDEFSMLDIVDVAVRTNGEVATVTELYFGLSERYEVDRLLHHITGLARDDRWSSTARSALRSDLYAALSGLTSRVARATEPGAVDARIAAWEDRFAEGVGRTRATLAEIAGAPVVDLATLSVALRSLRTLVEQGAS